MNTVLKNKTIVANIETIMKRKGYKFFINGAYNLNLIGIRSEQSIRQNNIFDDILLVMYKTAKEVWIKDIYTITTDPGLTMLKAPINTKGCAILVPGQYVGMFKVGYHRGQYKALVQNKSCKVYRDNNKDNVLNYDSKSIDTGLFGINLHKAGQASVIVDGWSAGCQVVANVSDFDKLMRTIDTACKTYGDNFTYTLLNEKDLDE